MGEKIIKAKSWKDLPRILRPGVVYDIDGVMIKPHERMTREEARSLVKGVREMVESW